MDQEANRLLQKFTLEELIEYESRLTERIYELKLEQLSSYEKLVPSVDFMVRLIKESNIISKRANELLSKNGKEEDGILKELKYQLLLKDNKVDETYLGRVLYLQEKQILGPIKLSKVADPASSFGCLLSFLVKKHQKISVESFKDLHDLIDALERAPSKIQMDIFGPDLLLGDGVSFDSLLTIEKPLIDENFILNEISFDYKVSDKRQSLQKELDSFSNCQKKFKKQALENLEEFIINKLASREEILNMGLILKLHEGISVSNENNNLLLPLMQVDEDPFYYYALMNGYDNRSSANNPFITKLVALGENAKEIYGKKINSQLEDCIDAFDVFIMLNKLAIEHPGKMHLVKPFVYEFCEKKGFKLLGIEDSFTFGMGCDFSGRQYPFESIPDNVIPRFTLPSPSD
jgi:hypothetical protein